MRIIVKAWNNGEYHPNGNGYGIRIGAKNRDEHFKRQWKTVSLELEGEPESIDVNIDKPSFWDTSCLEIISVKIGKWLIKNRRGKWPRGLPPRIVMNHIGSNRFHLQLIRLGPNNPAAPSNWMILPPWHWEDTGQVYVFGLDGVSSDNVDRTIRIINGVIEHHHLPLEVLNGNTQKEQDQSLLQGIINKVTIDGKIQYRDAYNEIKSLRRNGSMKYGVMFMVDPMKVEFTNGSRPDEKPVFGWEEGGICGIRVFDIPGLDDEIKKNAVVHEFGHMIGMFHHDGPSRECVMDYCCRSGDRFCNQCKDWIREIWGSSS